MGKFSEISKVDLPSVNTRKLMICILIDSSYSMIFDNKINMVNDGIRSFIKSGNDDVFARDALDVCLITFNGNGVNVIQDFESVRKIQFSDIIPTGDTPLKSAAIKAIDKIVSRKKYWSNVGASTYRPWLIIISDGKSNEDVTEPARKIQKMYRDHQLKGKCIAVGNGVDIDDLKKFAPNGKIEKMSSIEITNYFSLLSMSAAALSMSAPDTEDDSYEII